MRFGVKAFGASLVALSALCGLSSEASAGGHVYVMRGFTGMFSTGMDQLATKLRARGVDATVHPYGAYNSLATEAAALYRRTHGPIVIIGHSMGADSAISMAEELRQNRVPVALIVTFSPSNVSP